METLPLENARCLSCGYLLRGLIDSDVATVAPRPCPECGRTFDPAKPRTMNVGRPVGAMGRRILQPIGWPMVVLSILCAAGVLSVSRWPPGGLMFSMMDVKLVFTKAAWIDRATLPVPVQVYLFSAMGCVIFCGLCIARLTLRLATAKIYRQQPIRRAANFWRVGLVSFCFLFAAGGAIFGWPYRMGMRWMVLQSAMNTPVFNVYPPNAGYLIEPPVSLDASERTAVLWSAAMQLSNPLQRISAVKQLVERRSTATLSVLIDAVPRERDANALAVELQLIGLFQQPDTARLLVTFLDHNDPLVRTAAADAIGFVYGPSIKLTENPLDPVDVTSIFPTIEASYYHGANDDSLGNNPPMPAAIRERCRKMMVDGTTDEERTAAARATVLWPPENYRLRVAECGIWTASRDGAFSVNRPRLYRPLPAFLHAVGNGRGDMLQSYIDYDRVLLPMDDCMPIINMTSDRPLAVSVDLVMKGGRPYLAYPMPDDFTWSANSAEPEFANELSGFEDAWLPPIAPRGRGFQWLHTWRWQFPHFPIQPCEVFRDYPSTGFGLSWTSLIVSPVRLSWMNPNQQQSPSWDWMGGNTQSWISNQGDSAKFLYYAGPTAAQPGYPVDLFNGRLKFGPHMRSRSSSETDLLSFPPQKSPELPGGSIGWLIQPGQDGIPSGHSVRVADGYENVQVRGTTFRGEQALSAEIEKSLVARGLTAAEATALVRYGEYSLFGGGSRFIRIMSAAEYDSLCPIRVRPTPTEMVRVGLVVTEF